MSKKSAHFRKVQDAREERVPKKGATVYYPDPLPSFAHSNGDPETPALPEPSGAETWRRGKVREVTHLKRTGEPDDWVALVEPDDFPGMSVPIGVVFLLSRRPAKKK